MEHYKAKAEANKNDSNLPQYTVALIGPMENVAITCDRSKDSETLFSCHTDTVHWKGGEQEVLWDSTIFLAYKEDKAPLGADDGTGVWLMMQMLDAGVPGTYVFHRGEERGCIGSRWMKENRKEWLKTFKRAIAFDRRDTSHVITRQRGSDCCSIVFADALAAELNIVAESMGIDFNYKPDPTGVFTDTANYIGHIPECTNISIGYENAHGGDEYQDVEHAIMLAAVLRKVNWTSLPTVREAKEETYSYGYSGGYYGSQRSSKTLSVPEFVKLMLSAANDFNLPWARSHGFNASRREKKKHDSARRFLTDAQRVINNPPDNCRELDSLTKEERKVFFRTFPDQADQLVEELLTLRRLFLRYSASSAFEQSNSSSSQSSSPVVSSPNGAQETPPSSEREPWGWEGW